jgi:hypothetical protein
VIVLAAKPQPARLLAPLFARYFNGEARRGLAAYQARAASWIPDLEDSVHVRRRNRSALGTLARLEEANGLRRERRQNCRRDKKISGRSSSTRSKEAK